MRPSLLFLAVVALLATSGARGKKLTLVTRNLGLFNGFDGPAKEVRRDIIIDELRRSKADGICLQEVWYRSDMAEIISELADVFPYTFSGLHAANGRLIPQVPQPPLCDSTKLVAVVTCALTSCGYETTPVAFLTCTFANCYAESAALSGLCRNCIYLSRTEDFLQECATPRNDSFNYGGLLVLSKRRFQDTSFVPLDVTPTANWTDSSDMRGYIQMRLRNIQGTFVCTHLTEDLPGRQFFEPALTQYSSFQDRNLGQVMQLLDALNGTVSAVLMGTLGTGPKYRRAVVAEFPRSYKALRTVTPEFKRSSVKRCTKCALGTAVDHIMARGFKLKGSRRAYINDTITDHAAMQAIVKEIKAP